MVSLTGCEYTICRWGDALGLSALPEMVFGSNRVVFVHRPSGVVVDFNAFDALLGVWRVADGTGRVKDYGTTVRTSDAWEKSREYVGHGDV